MEIVDFQRLVGRRVVAVLRILYPYPPEYTVDPTDGDVELVFDDGGVVHLKHHAPTDRVVLTDEAWVSRFGGRECFDVTAEAQGIGLLGEVVEVIAVPTDHSPVGGLIVATERAWLYARVGADMLIVHMAPRPIGPHPMRLVYPERLEPKVRIPEWHKQPYVPNLPAR